MPGCNRVPLTLREAEIGKLVVAGQTSADIGGSLAISRRTVEKHIERIRQKLGADSRAGMVLALSTLFGSKESPAVADSALPVPPTSFIGREQNLADIKDILDDRRLVSVVGPSGVGKTRVALRLGSDLAGQFADGVWFIELGRLPNAEYLESTIARAMQLTLGGEADALASLVRSIAHKRALLILDTCEHIVDAVARVAAAIVRDCPNTHVLATTRRRLRISAERVYTLAALPTPPEDESISQECILQSAAVALFVERARHIQPGFSLTSDNASVVAKLCRQLQGNAFSIELAAARIGSFTPSQLCERFDQGVALPGNERGKTQLQHRTLFAAIEWSFDLLGEQQRSLFRRLAIFTGGWDMEAAAAVCLDPPEAESILDFMSDLVEHSLVLVDFTRTESRYSFLESTRQFANLKLQAAGEAQDLADRHFVYFAKRLERAGDDYARFYRQSAVLKLEPDLDNARSAITWSISRGRLQLGAALFVAAPLWSLCGLAAEERSRALTFLKVISADDGALNARLWLRVRKSSYALGDNLSAWQASKRAVESADSSCDHAVRAASLANFSFTACAVGRLDDAAPALERAEVEREAAEANGQPTRFLRITILEARAYLAHEHGDCDAAVSAYENMAKICREIENVTGEAAACLNIIDLETARGNSARAIALAYEFMPRTQKLPRQDIRAGFLRCLAGMLAEINDIVGSKQMAREAIALLVKLNRHPAMIATAIEHLALALSLEGEVERPARLAGYCDAVIVTACRTRRHIEQVARTRLMCVLKERAAVEELGRLQTQGAMLSLAAAVAEALDEKSFNARKTA